MRGSTSVRNLGGYLLLEVVLALGIAAGVLTGVFMIANGSLSLADTIVKEGRIDARREAFLEFLERNFSSLPGSAIIELRTVDTGRRFLPTLTIQNAPTSFSFAGQAVSAQAVVLSTVPVPSGGINVVLDYYDVPILDDNEEFAEQGAEPVGSIILYKDIWRFELRALDLNNASLDEPEWFPEWEIRGRLPVQFELNAVFTPDGEEVVHYFWLPPKTNPATLLRQSLNTRRQGGTGQNEGSNTEGGASP